MQYALENLGPDNFEHMGQALMLKMLGPTTRVYGQGKDGGREFTFEGEANVGAAASWKGYVVGQAKYRGDRHGTSQDQVWFLDQIASEMRSWTNPKSERRTKNVRLPEYLLFITNVRLSPAAGGGLDRLDSLMEGYRDKLDLRGWHVLHREAVERLLDANLDVRRRYAALIAPADAFRAAIELVDVAPNVNAVLLKHAQKLLRSERIIRLSEQGIRTSEKLYVENIGTDLPAVLAALPGENKRVHTRVVQHIMKHGENVLAPYAKGKPKAPPHVLIIGDPGQGKTTISQMVTQFYRAALMQGSEDAKVSSRVDEVIAATLDAMQSLGIDQPHNRRWPVRVDLAAYGDAISGGEDLTLLRWITRAVNDRTEERVTNAAMLGWLQQWPWLIVLDGLDEVAHPKVRENVRARIDDFLVEAADADADMLMVVTSRPQGYDHTFPEADFLHIRLAPLTPNDAIAYARRLAVLRNADDEELQRASLERMREAIKLPLTAKLMTTPLQVTIMLLLLEIAVRVPTSRFELFESYFDTIYTREASKKGHLARLLELHRPNILWLHRQVGFLLQKASAGTTNAEAVLSLTESRALVAQRLADEGLEGAQLNAVADQIETAALNRLVLLVSRNDGVGFEVRSLQEFMAASAITTGPEESVMERLASIAPSAHWRNTWLLALGQVFVKHEHLRARVVTSMREVDITHPLGLVAPLGPRLALAVLADGMTERAPKYRNLLLQHWLESLTQPPPLGGFSDEARLLCDVAKDERARSLTIRAFETAEDGPSQRRATTRLLLEAVTERDLTGNLVWAAAKRLGKVLARPLNVDETAVFEAWQQGRTLLPDPPENLISAKDRRESVSRVLVRLIDATHQPPVSTGTALHAVLRELEPFVVTSLEPDFHFCMPPGRPLRAPATVALVSDDELATVVAGALSSLRPGFWPLAAHLVDLLANARERAVVESPTLDVR